jgi:hypothetical protein
LDRALPAAVAATARQIVPKVLRCRTPAAGYIRYRCVACRREHTVCLSCKTRFCPGCGRARAAEAATLAQGRLLNVRHRHLVFCVPAQLRTFLNADRRLLTLVAKAAAYTVLRVVDGWDKKHTLLPGIMATVHTFGSDLRFNPHVHLICTEGALGSEGRWHPVKFFPIRQCKKLWQYYLLTFLRRKLRRDRSAQWQIGHLFQRYPEGCAVNVMSSYRNGVGTAAYCCRYTGRPPLAEYRITHYDGQHVTFTWTDYKHQTQQSLQLPAVTFLLRLLQHLWPRYQRDVHYYGLYLPAKRKAYAAAVVKASKFGEQTLPRQPLSRVERLIFARAGQQESRCPTCGNYLEIEHIAYPRSLRKHHATSSQKPRSGRAPPAAPAAQLSLSM